MSDTRDMQDEDLARVRAAVETLSEYFDAVQVFATRHESGELDGTVRIQLGAGNWFARYGHVKHWMVVQDESARIGERREQEEDNP